MSYFTSKTLLAAKALAQKDWTYPSVILAARHMANNGSTLEEIKEFLGWNVHINTARDRLAKYRIFPFSRQKIGHRGQNSVLSAGGAVDVNQGSFKARKLNEPEPSKNARKFKCSDCEDTFKQLGRGKTRRRCERCAKRYISFAASKKYHAKKAATSP